MELKLPKLSLVVLVGCSGSGKSTFARKHFKSTEVLSSDYCRGLVSDDENAQDATGDAFSVLHFIAAKRLRRGLLTVVDATNVQPESRKPLVELAREHDVLPVAIVLNIPDRECHERNKSRPDRQFGEHVVRNQNIQLRRSLRGLQREGFRHVFVMNSIEEVDAATIVREPLWNDKRNEHGPFDIIGDVHGCYEELVALLEKLGYDVTEPYRVAAPPGRKIIFLGDLVDRGPDSLGVINLVRSLMLQGIALCVPGNHDVKLLRKLSGKNVQLTHGLAETMEQLAAKTTAEERGDIAKFIDRLISHYVLDGGKLVVAHAGMKEAYQGRGSGRVREFALYGETTGETDEFGLPVRLNWAAEYRGKAAVVYGHTPVPHAEWLNHTINIDTGCVFGGALTAMRYPENEIVSVPAKQVYAMPAKPLIPDRLEQRPAQQIEDDVLDLEDVNGKRLINTRLMSNITVREENATAALEVMSRFAANPKWLIYLPPTMSPSETTLEEGLLEHPREAFAYFRNNGVVKVICEEKHMGSRAVVIVCRDGDVVSKRFGIIDESERETGGIIYTRTGRRFFDEKDRATEIALLDRVREACTAANFWEEFKSDWFCLDCELMPWSAKAQSLLQNQYAAVGSAAMASTNAVMNVLERATRRLTPLPVFPGRLEGGSADSPLIDNLSRPKNDPLPASPGVPGEELASWHSAATLRSEQVSKYIAAYQQYCWPLNSVDDLKLAPFHLLASEGAVHVDRNHEWHMSTLARLASDRSARSDGARGPFSGPIIATTTLTVEVNDPVSETAGIEWWTSLTARGGEGMVVKPIDFITRAERGLVQPAIKCRGREYLRIIYGPEYDSPANLERLRRRGVGRKRGLVMREFSLGVEALERFVRREPLRRVHECVFGVLAMESEPVDPRL